MNAETVPQRIARLLREEVEIVPGDPAWPRRFAEEEARLRALFPGLLGRIEHFGSTAVPGLAAKPIIDMLVEVADLTEAREVMAPRLEAEGYDYLWRPTEGDDTPPWYAWFIKRDRSGRRTHHIHVVEPGFTDHWDRLLFRDYLRAHVDVAAAYEGLKRTLAEGSRDRLAYAVGKKAFIDGITALAKAQRQGRAAHPD